MSEAISPVDRAGSHIQHLANISRMLKDSENREKLLNVQCVEEVVDVLLA